MGLVQRCFVVAAQGTPVSVVSGEENLAGTEEVVVLDESEEHGGEYPAGCGLLELLLTPLLEGGADAVGGLCPGMLGDPGLVKGSIFGQSGAHVLYQVADDRLQGCCQ